VGGGGEGETKVQSGCTQASTRATSSLNRT